jgi:transcriptional regulator with XRE-family HTH domain
MRIPSDTPDWLERTEQALFGWWNWKEKKRLPTADLSTVGGRIRIAREVVGLSQESLAARIGMTGLQLSAVERGKANLRSEKIPGLCLSLRISQDWLITGEGPGGPGVPGERMRSMASPEYIAWVREREQHAAVKEKAARAAEQLRKLRFEIAERNAKRGGE